MSLVHDLNVRRLHAEATRVRMVRGLPAQTLDEACCRMAHDATYNAAQCGRIARNHCQVVANISDPDAALLDCFHIWESNSEDLGWLLSNEVVGYWVSRSERGTFWAARFGKPDVQGPTPTPEKWWSSWWDLLFGR